jgi:hypothetical protein
VTTWLNTEAMDPGVMVETSAAVIEPVPPIPPPAPTTFDPAVGWTTTTADEVW